MFKALIKWATRTNTEIGRQDPIPLPEQIHQGTVSGIIVSELTKDISEPVLSLVELIKARPSWFKRKYRFCPNMSRDFICYDGKTLDITITRRFKSPLFTSAECMLINETLNASREERLEVVRLYLRAKLEKKLKQTLSNINGDI